MASSEFPLRTNYELARILRIYNGSNEIEIVHSIDPRRLEYVWAEDKDLNEMKPIDFKNASNVPSNYAIKKGYAYVVVHRGFAQYAVRDERALGFLKWIQDTYSPDET